MDTGGPENEYRAKRAMYAAQEVAAVLDVSKAQRGVQARVQEKARELFGIELNSVEASLALVAYLGAPEGYRIENPELDTTA